MALLHRFVHLLATFYATAPAFVHANLCAFGCREFPQHQIASSAQFRSFIMPRERGDCAAGGCCGAMECGSGDGDAAESGEGYGGGGDAERKVPETDNAEGTREAEKLKNAIPDIAAFLKALLPRQSSAGNADVKKSVWYSALSADGGGGE